MISLRTIEGVHHLAMMVIVRNQTSELSLEVLLAVSSVQLLLAFWCSSFLGRNADLN